MTEIKDMLVELFNLQHDLQVDTYGYNFQRMTTADRVRYIKEMKLALSAELQEALDETSWKPWASAEFIHENAYVGELVDALHFLVNMFLVTGEEPTELAKRVFTLYRMKNRLNERRQLDGYDGGNKCPSCRRALDDPAVACDSRPQVVGHVTLPLGDTDEVLGQWCEVNGMFNPNGVTVKLP